MTAPLLRQEMKLIARLSFEGSISRDYRNPSEPATHVLLDSLKRFGFVENRYAGHSVYVYTLTDPGKDVLVASNRRLHRYRCCEHAIRLQCVCLCNKHCPNPEHASTNGCHGSHD